MIDLNEMAVFAEVVNTGSFTAAGKQLGFPKSTVSRKVSMLEERLGVQLIHRTTRSLNLTDAGNLYYQHCLRIVTEAREADLQATQKQIEPAGLIKITAPPGFHFLSEYIADFLAEYHQIEVEIDFEARNVDLINEGYDLSVRVGPLKDSNLIARLLGVIRVVFCASPRYLNKHGCPDTIEALREHRIIQGIPWNIVGEARLLPADYPKRVKTNSNEVARSLTKKGLGITMLSESECAEDIRSGSLKTILQNYPLPEKKIYLLYPSNRHLSVKISRMIEFILEKWRSNPPW